MQGRRLHAEARVGAAQPAGIDGDVSQHTPNNHLLSKAYLSLVASSLSSGADPEEDKDWNQDEDRPPGSLCQRRATVQSRI